MNHMKYFRLLGVLLFIYIIQATGLENILNQIRNINLIYIIPIILLFIPLFFIKALRWKLLTETYNITDSLTNYIKGIMIGNSIGTFTPGRLGDFTRALELKKTSKLALNHSIITIIADRIEDIIILIIMAIFGTLFFAYRFGNSEITINLFFVSITILFIMLISITKKNIVKKILKPFFNKLIPEKHKDKIRINFHEFYAFFNKLSNKKITLLKTLILTLSSWIIIFFQTYLMSQGLNINISYIMILSIMPLVVLIEIIPISISGIGTRDVLMIYLLSFILIAPESAVLLSLGILFINYLGTVPGFILLMFNNLKINKDIIKT
ncbi:MAG: flippase-like domain-containing protein [DPANN group archaeon]|nr:flippase-like domain-containing protein [DPANN group archaeon]